MKYQNRNISDILLEYGFEVIEYKSKTNIKVIDKDGFFYNISLNNLLNGKAPSILMKNPFAIDNIKRYLFLNYPNYELLDNEYLGCKQKMRFICQNHEDYGIQYNSTDNIMNNHHACKYCSYESMGKERQMDTNIILKRCKELSIKYISKYSKNNETWIKFMCNEHSEKGVQEINWYHLKTCAKGCPYCTGRYKTTQDFVDEIKYINPNIEIVEEYCGSESPVECKCKICGHVWSPIGRSVRNGQGCPACKMSNGEIKVKLFLELSGISFITQHSFDDCIYKEKLKFDFYIPLYNIIIEYDGEQHFYPVDFASKGQEWAEEQFKFNKKRDEIKNNYCKNNNIKIIRIPYYELNDVEKNLTSELLDVIFV